MSTLDLQQVRDELCNFLRQGDVLSTSVRGVSRVTSSYSVGVGGESAHTFTGNIPVRDFKVLTVDAIPKYFLRDYTMNWNTGVLTWNTPLTNGQVVVYQLDFGSGDKIFPDYPREDLTLTSFPRVGIEITSVSTSPLGLGGGNHISDILVTIYVWVPANKDSSIAGGFGGLTDLEATIKNIRDVMRTNAKNFYTFSWIYPKGESPLIRGQSNKVMQKSIDFFIRFKIE